MRTLLGQSIITNKWARGREWKNSPYDESLIARSKHKEDPHNRTIEELIKEFLFEWWNSIPSEAWNVYYFKKMNGG